MPPPRGVVVRRCGGFLLGRRVGAGGMAAVFAAVQRGARGVGRLVAVKVMSTAIADDPEFQRMFVREATIATRLEHPNTVRVYEVDDHQGDLYLAMEFVHGASLAALLRAATAPPPLAVALEILGATCKGLHAAHELTDEHGAPLGLVHQDVSPQNIMIGYDGSVRLLDFGVARLGSLDASRTETVRGKPSYLAPEQLLHERLDRRTDVFALGAVAHELFTGRRLFDGEDVVSRYRAVLDARVPDVREIVPDVPAELAAAVARALSRAPDARFATADDFRRALARAAAGLAAAADVDAQTAAWARALVPPTFTVAELEREIVDGARGATTPVADVSDVPTLKEAPAAAGAEARGRWTRAGIAAVVVAAGAVAATVVLRPFGTQAEEGGQAPAAVAPELGSLPAPAALPPEPAPAESSVNGESPEATVLPPARTPPKLPGRDAPGTPQRALPVPSAAPSAAPATTEAAMGALGVWSNVSGRVSVDGSYVGDSPIPRIALRPGSHEVSIVTPDGSQQQSVDIRPGELAKIRFAF